MARGHLGVALRHLRRLYAGGTIAGLGDGQLLDRYASDGDEDAFASIVARHGPMVLAVCRAAGRDESAAEDAFQATFLVLARKARSLRAGESLGGWLHKVGRRIAVRAGVETMRRREKERMAALVLASREEAGEDGSELSAILHEEIARLPARYRSAIVLCDLEGLTREEAAGQLGWPAGTVAGRLARGRSLLRDRLRRRGIAPAASALAIAVAEIGSASDALTPQRIGAAADRVSRIMSGGPDGSTISPLADGVLVEMRRIFHRKLAIGSIAFGMLLAGLSIASSRGKPPRGEVALSGIVVEADGRPAAGVEVDHADREGGGRFGRIDSRTETDAEGRFRIVLNPGGVPFPGRDWGSLWAYRPGSLAASRPLGEGRTPPGLPIRLVLGPPSRARFAVRDPAGMPVAGARVLPRVLARDFLSAPDGLAERAGAITDAAGKAVLSAFLPEEVRTVYVVAPGFGGQQFGFGSREIALDEKVLDLLPAGRVSGRVVGGTPEERRGISLLVATNSRSRPSPAPGLVEVVADAEGRFEVPEIAAGSLGISNEPTEGSTRFVRTPKGRAVEPGKTTEVILSLSKGLLVSGSVRDRATKRPIEGVEIAFGSARRPVLTTDARGHYRGFVPPGGPSRSLKRTPSGYAGLLYGIRAEKVPEDVAEFEYAPIELTAAGPVRGIVEGPDGRPIAGAEVAASWPVDEVANRDDRRDDSVLSDENGEFVIPTVPLGASVDLSASHLGLRTPKPEAARQGGAPARLRLGGPGAASMTGRVVDQAGAPVAGARVRLRSAKRFLWGEVDGDRIVDFDGLAILVTDADGRYRTPTRLDRDLEYRAIVEADGFRSARTDWVRYSPGGFPALTLAAESGDSAIDGRVVDRGGRPVVGAAVWSPDESGRKPPTRTDGEGRFRLDSSGTFLFARAEGYRFFGRFVGPRAPSIEVRLFREDEPPDLVLRTLPRTLDEADRRAIARKALESAIDEAIRAGDAEGKFRALSALASIDPSRLLRTVEDGELNGDRDRDRARSILGRRVFGRDHAAGIALIEAIGDPFRRGSSLLELPREHPETERALKLEILDRAASLARTSPNPGERVLLSGRIAEQWLDLGEEARGSALLREAEPIATGLPKAGVEGYHRGAFAEELARIDPGAALRLVEGIVPEKSFPDRHKINIAQRLASRDPAAADRLLKAIPPSGQLSRALPRLGFAMAPKDLDRAKGLLGLVDDPADPFEHAYALGMMALAIAPAEKEAAKALLREAFSKLDALADEGRIGPGTRDASITAAALIPVAEAIDPGLVAESLWRALSYRGGHPGARSATNQAWFDSALALLASRYDRRIARALIDPLASRPASVSADRSTLVPLIDALAEVDPEAASRFVEALPEEPGPRPERSRTGRREARIALASWLVSGESRWSDQALKECGDFWRVGGEDIY